MWYGSMLPGLENIVLVFRAHHDGASGGNLDVNPGKPKLRRRSGSG